MRPERITRLAGWLRTLAEREDGSARVLAQFENGDPSECETKARLFREIAETLEIVSQKPVEAAALPSPPTTPEPPPTDPAGPVAHPSRLEL